MGGRRARWAFGLAMVAAFALAWVGMLLVSAVAPWPDGDVLHFPLRHFLALLAATAAGVLIARCRSATLWRASPFVWSLSLLAVAAVFVPGLGIRASGAHRWLKLGPASFAPAPFLVWSSGLAVSAWAPPSGPDNLVEGSSRRRALVLAAEIGRAHV